MYNYIFKYRIVCVKDFTIVERVEEEHTHDTLCSIAWTVKPEVSSKGLLLTTTRSSLSTSIADQATTNDDV